MSTEIIWMGKAYALMPEDEGSTLCPGCAFDNESLRDPQLGAPCGNPITEGCTKDASVVWKEKQ